MSIAILRNWQPRHVLHDEVGLPLRRAPTVQEFRDVRMIEVGEDLETLRTQLHTRSHAETLSDEVFVCLVTLGTPFTTVKVELPILNRRREPLFPGISY